jgi:hypothetical protein
MLAILRELRRLLNIQKEHGRNVAESVVLKIGILAIDLEKLGEKPFANKLTVFALAAMPMPSLPSDPPPETMEKFLEALHETINSDLDRLEKIHLS